jgi:hypothetical protein
MTITILILALILFLCRKAIARSIKRAVRCYVNKKKAQLKKAAASTAKRAGRAVVVGISNTMIRLA